MKSFNERQWPAQAAPLGFASRTTEAMLQTGRELQPLPDRLPRGRLGLYLVLAAAFVSSAAWAGFSPNSPWAGNIGGERLAVATPFMSRVAFVSPPPDVAPVPRSEPEVPSPAATAAPLPLRRPKPVVKSVATVLPPRALAPMPRCQCGPGAIICACID